MFTVPGTVSLCSFTARQELLLLKYHKIAFYYWLFCQSHLRYELCIAALSYNKIGLPQKVYCLSYVLLSFSDLEL